ncbi:hypothetical protein TNCT_714961 [Trichonephila clavata]|uniref:Uncharacterized protein n=1 Tax=Trichonephila clavata TaxID=2740835 RepID=A0A8X6HCC6_TRICU|nr:hypothetical protein TNCT_714961 [Trichonephila clavata]
MSSPSCGSHCESPAVTLKEQQMSRQKHFPARNFAFIEKREPMNGNSSCDGNRKQCHTSTCCEMPFFKMRNERSSITGWRCPAPPGGYKSSAESSLRASPPHDNCYKHDLWGCETEEWHEMYKR